MLSLTFVLLLQLTAQIILLCFLVNVLLEILDQRWQIGMAMHVSVLTILLSECLHLLPPSSVCFRGEDVEKLFWDIDYCSTFPPTTFPISQAIQIDCS